MGLRIRTNVPSEEVQRHLRKASEATEKEFSKLASGKRIVTAADDAAGLAISSNLEGHVRGIRQATRNAHSAISMIQTAEGGISEVSNILVRLKELAVQAASDTISDTERELINKEVEQIVQEVDRIGESTVFGGTKILSGEADLGELQFYVGADDGEENIIQYDSSVTNVSSSELGIDGINVLEKGDAAESISSINEAVDKVSSMRASVGSVQARLQYTISNLESLAINHDHTRSLLEDVDVAKSTARLASSQITKQAGTTVLAQANQIPMSAFKLLAAI